MGEARSTTAMTSPPTLRWGLIGAARIAASALIPAFRSTGSPIVALGCSDPVRGAAFAATHEIPLATRYDALLERDDIDAVYIALPNHAHLPLTLAALNAGKHVLCEKPLALSADEARQMKAAASAAGRLVMEAFMHRFHPQLARAQALVHGEAWGPLKWMRSHFTYTLHDPADVRWSRRMGGGALYDLGCYPLSLMRWLAGVEPVVLGVAAGLTPPDAEGGRVDHAAHATLRFDTAHGDVTGHFDCAFSLPPHTQFEALLRDGILRLETPFGWKDVEAVLRIGEHVERFAPCDPYALMVRHFEAAALGHEAVQLTLDDSIAQAVAMDALLARAHAAANR
jgi:predicted dehydrogenase